ncbi:unnamed protein product [Ectocarpus sp. 4 AP-2014]
MKRHGDRKAYFERRQQHSSLQWSGRVGDKDRAAPAAAAAAATAGDGTDASQGLPDSNDAGTPASSSASREARSPSSEQRTVRDLTRSVAKDDDGPVPVGEHHQGSFGVYMSHKMDKLRRQVDGAVPRLQGKWSVARSDGNVFKGVVAHFNGHFPVPVSTLRELLVSRGGIVEAYNTSRCTHMICEVLPAAKIRELRKLRHPPPVVRSAWVQDSAEARRKLPLADYTVDGIFAQKSTLAASFAAAATPKKSPPPPPPASEPAGVRRRFSGGNAGSGHGKASSGGAGPADRRAGDVDVRGGAGGGGGGGGSGDGGCGGGDGGVNSASRHGGPGARGVGPSPSESKSGHLSGGRNTKNGCQDQGHAAARVSPRHLSADVATTARHGVTGRGPGAVCLATSRSGGLTGSGAHENASLDGENGEARRPPMLAAFEDSAAAVGGYSEQQRQQQRQHHQRRRQHIPELSAVSAAQPTGGGNAVLTPSATHANRHGDIDTPANSGTLRDSVLEEESAGSREQSNDSDRNRDNNNGDNASGSTHSGARYPVCSEAKDAGGSGNGNGSGGGYAASGHDPSVPPPFELPEMGAAGEGGRSTKDDPAFMKTFFRNSRLHFIGVGRAHAVKVVNAGLAARALPGATQPVFGGRLGRGETRVILHVDMDCFFVSVLVKNRPELKDKPVAVAHNASNAKGAGSSEISSCNYPARAKGLRAGMFMMQAKKLCPELIVLRYDFEAYTAASEKMYGVFLRYAPVVMAVSCDEAFLELGEGTDPMEAATRIRRSIFEETGCSASAGASNNMLLARRPGRCDVGETSQADVSSSLSSVLSSSRMATKEAKPDGQFCLPPEVAMRHMGPLLVQDLPGVGWKLRKRLNEQGLASCSDLWPLSLTHMQKGLALGEKTGRALWEACRGIDKRPVQAPPDRKSIGAEVNYGVRFDTQTQADGFLSELAEELSRRMVTEGVLGRALTLKIMKQRDGVGLPRKYLGHGVCDARSKLLNLGHATADAATLKPHALQLLRECKVPPGKIRGIGLQMTRLVPASSGSGEGGVDVGRAGSLGGWLIKPGAAGGGSIDPPTSRYSAGAYEVVATSTAAEGEASSRSGLGDASTPASRAKDENLKPCDLGAVAEEAATVDTNSGEEEGAGSTAAVRRQCTTMTAASVASSGGAAAPPPKKRRREDEKKRDEAGPCKNSLESPDQDTGTPSSLPDVSDAASATAKTAGDLAAEEAEAGGAAGGSSPCFDSPESARKRKAAQDSSTSADGAGAPRNASIGCATPLAGRGARGTTRGDQAEPPPLPPIGIVSSRQAGGNSGRFSPGGGFSPPARRRTEPASPGVRLSPPNTPLGGTPPRIGSAGSPSMSQITFSQIDKTVLGALPPELRREVISQVEARKRQRQDGIVTLPPSSPHSGGGPRAPPRDEGRAGAGTGPRSREAPGQGGAAEGETREVVREGFDTADRSGPGKVQQVSIDSLWSLRKLREEGGEGDEPGAGPPSVFDRDSLRALPLGLGLHYASLTENQRAQIARRYSQAAEGHGRSSIAGDGSRGRGSSPARGGHGLSYAESSGAGTADDVVDDGSSLPPPPSNRPPPASPASSPGMIAVSLEAVGQASPLRGDERSAELFRLSLSQVDRDVLDCLPSDVRDEVLRSISANAGGSGAGGEGGGGRSGGSGNIGSGGINHYEDDQGRETTVNAYEAPDGEQGGRVDMEDIVDICSLSPQGKQTASGGVGHGVFDVEPAGTLRGVLRRWIGGAVRSPSQWHLELLYRYLEDLVEGGRLDETATLLRCLGRLSAKASETAGQGNDVGGSAVGSGGGGWVEGYRAVLGAVQDLVRKRTGGASLALMC